MVSRRDEARRRGPMPGVTAPPKRGRTLPAMSERDFYANETRKRVGLAVEDIEKGTSAEVVVTVRHRSGDYRHTDMFHGSVLAFAALAFMLFDTQVFDIDVMPINVVLAFVIGTALSHWVPWLRRAATSKRLLGESTQKSARAAFYDLGVSRTKGRTGILVYVSMFERRVEVVPDIAVKPEELGEGWKSALSAMQNAVAQGPDVDRFLAAMATMKEPLSSALPIQPDDVNELPNEPVMA
jgi:putative membrane protein